MERKIKEWEHILLQLVRIFFLACSLWLFIPWYNLIPLMSQLSAGNYFSCFCKKFSADRFSLSLVTERKKNSMVSLTILSFSRV